MGSLGFTRLRSTARGRLWLDGLLLRIPLVGPLNQKVILAKFSHFLSLLLSSGYEILPSLELVKDTVGNRSSVRAIETVHARIQAGDSLSNSMRGLGFIPFVISMIAVGEKSGMVTEQLDKVAEYYEREVDRGLKKLLALIEPILLVVFGAMAAVVILSTFMPMYQSMSLAK
jgi:type IV pilus assembly protein PilC